MQAVAKGTKIINEDGLISLIKAAPAPPEKPDEDDTSENEIEFVSSTAAAPKPSTTAPKAGGLAAELNKVRTTNKAPQAGPSRPLPLGRLKFFARAKMQRKCVQKAVICSHAPDRAC